MRIPPTSSSSRINAVDGIVLKLRTFRHLTLPIIFVFLFAGISFAQIDFEQPAFSLGDINGQNSWMKTGPFDAAVSSSNATAGFGAQSFRISNSITSGSFGDQTFSSSIANEAGESGAENGGISGGTRQNIFITEFSIASAQPGSQQPGLVISVSPDRGDGARMSYLRFEDHPDGIHVIFDDYVDAFPFGDALHDSAGCSDSDYFREFLIATLDRSQPHKIKLVMQFFDGPRNDKVQVFVDGVLSANGTSWEDYFRYCEGHEPRTVDSMLFRAGGTAAPGTNGLGFLFDNLTMSSATGSVITATAADTKGWFVSSNTVGGQVSYINDSTSPSGNGALRLTTTDDNQSRAHYQRNLDAPIPLSSVTEMSYYNKTNSGPIHAGASYALGVYLDGTPGSFTELVFEPYWNTGGPLTLTQHVWQKWDVYNGLQLWASQTVNAGGGCVTTAGSGGPPFYTLQGMQAACPNATVIYQKTYIGNYNRLYDIEVDLVSLNNTAYDFEPAAPTIVTVTQNDLTTTPNATDWLIYDDVSESVNNTLGSFVMGPGSVPHGTGSIQLSVTGNERKNIATYRFAGTPLADIDVLKFSTYNPSAGNGGGANNSGYLNFNVDFDGSDTWQRRIIFLPADNDTYQSPVAQNTWQEWDAIAAGTALWRYSGSTWPGTATSGETPKTWNQILSEYPGVRMRVTDAFFGVRVGEPYPDGYTENIDSITFGTSAGTTIFNFDPAAPAVTVNHPLSQPDPTSTGPINFTATFSEPVAGFDATDVILSGPGSGGTTAVVTGGPTVYNIAVSGMSVDGQVMASIGAGAATSVATSAPSAASTSTDNSVYFVATCNNVWVDTGITTLRNQQVTVPIRVNDLTGRGAFTTDMVITYDSNVLSYLGIQSTGTISDGSTFTVNSLTPGHLEISIFGFTDYTGSGVFLNLRFMADGAIGTESPISFTSFQFNNDIPCTTETDGSVSVISSTISGKVNYVNAPSTKPVPGVTLNASGGTPVIPAVTDSNGNYSLSNLGDGAYTVTPEKVGDVNHVNSFDAGQIAKHVVHLITLNANQSIAADINDDGTINSFDSGLLARWIVNIPNPGYTGTWVFNPDHRDYASVESEQTNQNYDAILIGDVSGDWTPSSPLTSFFTREGLDERTARNSLRISFDKVEAEPGSEFLIPITITNLAKKGVISYQFDVRFDPDVIEPREAIVEIANTVSEGRMALANSPEPGLIKVVVFGPFEMEQDGVLINLRMGAIGGVGTSSKVDIENFVANDNILAVTSAGAVAVASNSDIIRGTISDGLGLGVSSALVVMTDTTGNTRTTRSNSFGTFEFGNVQSGQTYTISVKAKGFVFQPQQVVAGEGLTSLEMISVR